MSISSINASMTTAYSSISAEKTPTTTKMVEDLGTILEEQGIDQETQEALQADLAAIIEEVMANSDGETLSREELKEAIDSVFSSYGLDAEEILGDRAGGPPPGPGGPPPTEDTETESIVQTLFEILAEQDEDDESEETSLAQQAEQMSQLIMDYLIGIDTEA